MILKFVEQTILSTGDEAEVIAIINDFLSNIGKKPSQDSKIQDEDHVKVMFSTAEEGRGGGGWGEGGGVKGLGTRLCMPL